MLREKPRKVWRSTRARPVSRVVRLPNCRCRLAPAEALKASLMGRLRVSDPVDGALVAVSVPSGR